MRILNVEQGSGEWFRARLGIPTASEFNRIITGEPVWLVCAGETVISRHRSEATAEKGRKKAEKAYDVDFDIVRKWEPSGAALRYRDELVAEWSTGRPESEYESKWMVRGRELEPEAVAFYELQRDVTTSPGGICLLNDGTVGCSPDRLVYEGDTLVGGLEIKCPSAPVHIGYLLGDTSGVQEAYRHQVQGALWVTKLKWWDVMSYYPGLPPAIVRVKPDPEWGAAFASIIFDFIRSVDDAKTAVRGHGFEPPKQEAA